MSSILSKLSKASGKKPIEPREIFMSLPKRDKRYEYPRDVQSEVWKKWFDSRDSKNTIIKMNTGSGKTIVGLMVLQSCLNEGKGPAIYVVPDNYLVTQVCNEAKSLGIQTATNQDDYSYTNHTAILVIPIHKLVNGRSIFGMRSHGNYPIGSALLDDVHACLDTIITQYSIRIPYTHELYSKVVELFSDAWKLYNSCSYTNVIEIKDPLKSAIIPFWLWQDKIDKVHRLLIEYNNNEDTNKCIFFNFPLIVDVLSTCNCIVTSKAIEIMPNGVSISKIQSFENAERRIFMSATLSDDSVFVSALGFHEDDADKIITPDGTNDIGDRLILFPRHLNSKITDEEIKTRVYSISEKYNVVVIVPSTKRAEFWCEDGSRIITKEGIEKAVSELKEKHVGLLVFVNRYDGIDLPDNACRMLVIDGLPPLRSEYDKYIQGIDLASSILLREQIQRIEQGMGRGVRSNSDSCCIILMGDKLADVLLRNNGVSYFSSATAEQYNLSKELWDLLKQENSEPSIQDVFELSYYSLHREVEWIQKSKERLSDITYTVTPRFDTITLALRKAFESASHMNWQSAIDTLDSVINTERSDRTKGYLCQIKAQYANFLDKSVSQQILISGRKLNAGILSPINGIQYDKVINNRVQAKAICEYSLSQGGNQNSYVIHVNALLSSLEFSPDADDFEAALRDIGEILGFISTRPDKETGGKGPDNLWAIGNSEYLIIECKSGATTETISKDSCNQLGGSVRWFMSEYGPEFTHKPIMVHKSRIVDDRAAAVPEMRIITEDCLTKLKGNISGFIGAMAQVHNWGNESRIQALLSNYHLRRQDIVQEYTIPFRT